MSDCDGFTSASIVYLYLTQHFAEYNPDIVYHIPDGKEHGLATLLDWFPENGENSLIIIPDAGSNDVEECKILADKGYDILILDHHLISQTNPYAVVINNQGSPRYENKSLSGVGVVYKFFEYVEKQEKLSPHSHDYIDLVMLGEVGDVMNMQTLENRYILTEGLKNIHNEFLQTLFEKQEFSLKGERTQIGVAFYIVPLINSMIRLGSQRDKEELFLAFIKPELVYPSTKRGAAKGDTETICEQMARICSNTKNRQNKERDKALELFDMQIIENCLDENKIIILNADDYDIPKTMTGLCAMGVASKYKRPVLIGRTDKDGNFKGSMRAPDNTPIKNFKDFLLASNLMLYVEGHASAAGQGLRYCDIDRLTAYANKELADVDFNESCWDVDFVVNGNCSYLTNLIDELDTGKEFWGAACPEALVVIENITINPNDIMYRGEGKNTVAFKFNDIEYIKFKDDELVDQLKKFEDANKINLTIVGTPQLNRWGGRTTRQFQIKAIDIKEVEDYDF